MSLFIISLLRVRLINEFWTKEAKKKASIDAFSHHVEYDILNFFVVTKIFQNFL